MFESWQSYRRYAHVLKRQHRYIHPPEVQNFLEAALKTAESRVECISKNSCLWRAQLGHRWREENKEIGEIPFPYCSSRMKPLHDRAVEGRANPKGISFLYLASNKNTAMAEVRPWIGSYISVGQFKVLSDLKIVDCTRDHKGNTIYFEEPSTKEREKAVWNNIDRAFSMPVTCIDDVADYIPTQVLSELFKTNGFDGIAYRSSLGDGYNLALFSIEAAEIINCFLYEVKSIKYDFVQVNGQYFLSEHNTRQKD